MHFNGLSLVQLGAENHYHLKKGRDNDLLMNKLTTFLLSNTFAQKCDMSKMDYKISVNNSCLIKNRDH